VRGAVPRALDMRYDYKMLDGETRTEILIVQIGE
jgi:hypothetical protein